MRTDLAVMLTCGRLREGLLAPPVSTRVRGLFLGNVTVSRRPWKPWWLASRAITVTVFPQLCHRLPELSNGSSLKLTTWRVTPFPFLL